MCGIAGILSPNPQQYVLPDLQRMTDALAHRGPDGCDHWRSTDGTVPASDAGPVSSDVAAGACCN